MNANEALSVNSSNYSRLQEIIRRAAVPDGLCSLLMIRYKVEKLFNLLHRMKEMETQFADKAVLIPDAVLTDADRAELLQVLMDGKPSLFDEASELDMLDPPAILINFHDRIADPALGHNLNCVHAELRVLQEHIESQLDMRLFLFVDREQSRHYKNLGVLTAKAIDAFPSAYGEFINAGNCYATQNHDACVFHSMRALEQPIHALAKVMRVKLSKHPDSATWGDFINAFDSRLKPLAGTKHTKKRDERLKFYSEARIEFACFKDAWRNHVMHKRELYSETRAREILGHARDFVERLTAEGLKE